MKNQYIKSFDAEFETLKKSLAVEIETLKKLIASSKVYTESLEKAIMDKDAEIEALREANDKAIKILRDICNALIEKR